MHNCVIQELDSLSICFSLKLYHFSFRHWNKVKSNKMNTLKALVIVAVMVAVHSDDFTQVISGNLVLDVSDFELPWAEAAQACKDRSAQLLSVSTAEKDQLLVDLFVNGGTNVALPGNNSWISATELNTREGVWTWDSLDNEPLFHSRWFIEQPDDLESLNCAYQAVSNLLYWRDANCSAPMYFICESTV